MRAVNMSGVMLLPTARYALTTAATQSPLLLFSAVVAATANAAVATAATAAIPAAAAAARWVTSTMPPCRTLPPGWQPPQQHRQAVQDAKHQPFAAPVNGISACPHHVSAAQEGLEAWRHK
jgi:hypothetical protein